MDEKRDSDQRENDDVNDMKEMLQKIAERVGIENQPAAGDRRDPRWDASLYTHIFEMRNMMHTLSNYAQALTGLVEQLTRKLDRNATISQENFKAITSLTEISKSIESTSRAMERNVRVIVRDNPLLMRDIYNLETNTVEIGLILLMTGEAMIFLTGTDSLMRSALFVSISGLISRPVGWGMICGMLGLYQIIAFTNRSHQLRLIAAGLAAIYFGVTGILTLLYNGGVMGWLPHILAFLGAGWIVSRGPSA